ncbi:MAG: helix-hairpin-helix domain-containing protein [Lachnospiraceae bacterium]|jgi:competence protein ComEA|nr:helix-hairpin-helix domain-containing protein [Lachnospiraceae bacterium]
MVLIKNKSKTGIFLVLFLCILIFLCSCSKSSYLDKKAEANKARSNGDISTSSGKSLEKNQGENTKDSGQKPKSYETWYVEVSGAVISPGVYKIKPGARIFEAIEKTGGITAEASLDDINQAAPIKDGQKITIKSKAEAMEITAGSGGAALVSLNKATKEELMTLPGVGESKASDIIKYREESGGFSTLEELMKIPGIKEGVYNKLSDKIALD